MPKTSFYTIQKNFLSLNYRMLIGKIVKAFNIVCFLRAWFSITVYDVIFK